MHNIGIFKIIFERTGKRTKKKYLYLDNFSYTSNLDLYKKSKDMLKRYASLSNVILLEYDVSASAYVAYTTSKKKIYLYPIKDREQ